MIRRNIEPRVVEYLNRTTEHPNVLLLEGARQVGKTTLLEQLRTGLSRPLVHINLEKDRRALANINQCVEFSDFELLLKTTYGFSGDGTSVLCIDEAQESPVLGGLVRFMKESWTRTPVVLTGSSLSRLFSEEQRFPVGRVSRMLLQPFSYAEFLRCAGKEDLISQDAHAVTPLVHESNLKMLQTYMDVGGLPAVATAHANEEDWRGLRRDLYLDYQADFSRIFSDSEAALFDRCLRGTASNLGSPSLYSQMAKAQSAIYRKVPTFLTLLEQWKILHRTEVRPTKPENEPFAPKRYLYDIGLAGDLRLSACPRIDVIDTIDAAQRTPLGGLIENMLATELVALNQELVGWKGGINSYEVDFVFRRADGRTVPVECKAALRTKKPHVRGIQTYNEYYGAPLGILVNLAPPSTLTTPSGLRVVTVPVYLAHLIGLLAEEQIEWPTTSESVDE